MLENGLTHLDVKRRPGHEEQQDDSNWKASCSALVKIHFQNGGRAPLPPRGYLLSIRIICWRLSEGAPLECRCTERLISALKHRNCMNTRKMPRERIQGRLCTVKSLFGGLQEHYFGFPPAHPEEGPAEVGRKDCPTPRACHVVVRGQASLF